MASPPFAPQLGPDAAVFVISVAAELSGLHPQTLRTYERLGLITPGRTGGGGRRYSVHDIDLLRAIAGLTSAGIGLEGVRRILDLEHRLAALSARNDELQAEIGALRQAMTSPSSRRRTKPVPKGPTARQPSPGQAVVVWRRGS